MKNLLFLAFSFMLVTVAGCENNDLLLSEKKLNSKIQNNWKVLSPSTTVDYNEIWSFRNGNVIIVSKDESGVEKTVSGQYSVDAKINNAYVTLSGFTFPNQIASHWKSAELNRKWTIVQLDNGVMYLSGKDDNNVIRSIEFAQR
ncbi:MAG: hypothetical protein ACKOX3_10260 [Bacteroidota bacterium]